MSLDDIPGRLGSFVRNYDLVASEAAAIPWASTTIVEVGVALGKSLAYGIDVFRRRSLRVEAWAVDTWEGAHRNGEQQVLAPKYAGDFHLFAHYMLSAPELLERMRIVRCDSVRAARLFDDASVDLVQLDAQHTREAVAAEILAWLPKVRPGGILGGDDLVSDFPGVEEAVRDAFVDDWERVNDQSGWTGWRHRKAAL